MSRVHFWVLAVMAAVSMIVNSSAQTPSNDDPWLILAGGEKGSINVHTTRQDLVRLYGGANVVDQDVDLGEGVTENATVLFPRDPARRIEILWKDPAAKSAPHSVTIRGEESRWHLVHGISLGTSLSELQRLNGKPFPVSGYGGDQPGAILSWSHGSLEKDLRGNSLVILRLTDSPRKGVPSPDLSLIEGNSDNPTLQKLRLHVFEIDWEFPTSLQ